MLGNLNYYNVFITVAKTGSISRAADKLYISQPAVSKSISNLEEQLGTTLFTRSSRGVKLTDEGRLLYEHVENAFTYIENAEDDIVGFGAHSGIELRFGVSTSLCRYVLLDYLKDYINDNPHINITIDCHATLNTIPLVEDGTLDIGLICKTDIPKDMTYIDLTEIHDIFVANQSYLDNLSRERAEGPAVPNPYLMMGNFTGIIDDTSAKPNVLSTRELLETGNLMLLEKENITRRHVERYLSENDILPSRVLEVNNMDLLIDFAAIGLGISGVVKEFAKEKLRTGEVVELPLSVPLPPRKIGFIYKRKRREITSFLTDYVGC
ncbi:MAG: LysR family transcriptional regulator [Eubacterium sp.]|jgi:DNA-binding transcriptional LysR family regulator|nr:LysR family transcriptional regulator [Eubacterium sp.]